MEAHQQRVVDEKKELDEKLQKLTSFFTTSIFSGIDEGEQKRLKKQSEIMSQYSDILGERIENF
jgi:hypothetical protein